MQGKQKGLLLIILILIVLAATALIIVLSVRTDVISDMVEADSQVPILLTVEQPDGELVTQAFFYQPGTDRGALFDIPSHTGVVVRSLNRIDTIDTVYFQEGLERYLEQVGSLLGVPLQFYVAMDLDGLTAVIDAVEGVPLFVTEIPENGGSGPRIPSGDVLLDGAKSAQYFSYQVEGERERERVTRHQKTVIALLERFGDYHEDLSTPGGRQILSENLRTNVGDAALGSLFAELEGFEAGRIITRQIEGVSRNVEIGEDIVTLLFPHQEGRWLRESVRQVVANLSSEESLRDENIVIRLEILNGTSVIGLASRTAERYRSFGFDVVSVGNAEDSDVERTVLINRTANELFAARTADIIRAPTVRQDLDPASPVDVTIIIGRDFDGRYVR